MCEACLTKDEEIIQLKQALYGRSYEPPEELRLTPTEASMLRVLASHDRLSQDWLLFDATRSENGGARYVTSIPALVKVHLCKLRRKLRPYGLEIETVRAQGYRLTAETRRRLLNWKSQTARAA